MGKSVGGKIQGIIYIQDLEALQKELNSVLRKYDHIVEKCVTTEDINRIIDENTTLEVNGGSEKMAS